MTRIMKIKKIRKMEKKGNQRSLISLITIPNQKEHKKLPQRDLFGQIPPKEKDFVFLPDLRAWKIRRSHGKAWKCYLGAALLLCLPSSLVKPINIRNRKQSILMFPENTELTRTAQQLFPKLNKRC